MEWRLGECFLSDFIPECKVEALCLDTCCYLVGRGVPKLAIVFWGSLYKGS